MRAAFFYGTFSALAAQGVLAYSIQGPSTLMQADNLPMDTQYLAEVDS